MLIALCEENWERPLSSIGHLSFTAITQITGMEKRIWGHLLLQKFAWKFVNNGLSLES